MPTPETPPLGERLKQLQENVQKCLEARDRGVAETQWGLQAVSILQEAREIKEILHGEGEKEMAKILDTIRRNFGGILTEEVGKTPRSPTSPSPRESTTAHELNEAYFNETNAERIGKDLDAFARSRNFTYEKITAYGEHRVDPGNAIEIGGNRMTFKKYIDAAGNALEKRGYPDLRTPKNKRISQSKTLKILIGIASGDVKSPEDVKKPKTKKVVKPPPHPDDGTPQGPPEPPVPPPAPHPNPLPRGEGTGPEPTPIVAPPAPSPVVPPGPITPPPKPDDKTPPSPTPHPTAGPEPVAPPSPKPPEPTPVAPPVEPPVPPPAPHPKPHPLGEGTGPEPTPEAAPEKADLSRYIEAILQSGEREAFLERLKGPSGRLWIDKKSADGKQIRIWLSLTPEDIQKLENGAFGTEENTNKPLPFRFRVDNLSAGNSWKEGWNGKKAAISELVTQLAKTKKSENRGLCEEIAQKLGIADAQKTAFSDRLFGYLTPDGAEKDTWTHVRNAYWHIDGWDTADQAKGKLTALGVTTPFTLPPYKETKVKTWEKIDARSSALLTPKGQYIVRMQGKDAAKYPLTERQKTDGTTSYHFAGLGWVQEDDLRICEKKEKQPDGSWKPVDPATFELMAWKAAAKPAVPPTPSTPPAVPPTTPPPATKPASPTGPKGPGPTTPAGSPAGEPKKGLKPTSSPPATPDGPKQPPKAPPAKPSPVAEKTTQIHVEAGKSIRIQQNDLPPAEAESIVQGAKINSYPSPLFKDQLTTQHLEKAKLHPRKALTIGKTRIAFSAPYDIGDGRIAVMAYVSSDGSQWIARSFYRSNSQAIWRYLPNYSTDGYSIDWYSKGYSEESICAPVACQALLAEMSRSNADILQLPGNPEFIFAGTARPLEFRGTFFNDVSPKAKTLGGNITSKDKEKKIPPEEEKEIQPEELKLAKKEEEPNFEKLLHSWHQESSLYGNVLIEVFPSNNNALTYMFCSDTRGRAWIGAIEDSSPVTSVGVRQEWIDGGDLTTPAFEYKSQTRGFGNAKLKAGHYVDMFEKYLSKIPIIQAYIESLKKRVEYRKS